MNSDLIQRQFEFSRLLPLLLNKAHELGFEVTMGECWRKDDPRCYGMRLAIDLCLWRDEKYLKDTKEYEILGEFWENIGGSWGGRFADGNHFSLAFNGKK